MKTQNKDKGPTGSGKTIDSHLRPQINVTILEEKNNARVRTT